MFPIETIVSRCKRRGFVYPGSSIYGGLANARDYGPYGIQLKKNIADLRWKTFVQQRPDMVGLDTQILMHPKVRETSGHTENFNDPLIDDKNTGERFRADKIIEERIEEMRIKRTNPTSNPVGEDGHPPTNEQILTRLTTTYSIPNLIPESRTFEQMKNFIIHEIPYNPNDKKKKQKADRTDVRKFQMMFYTYQGVLFDEENKVWLRPETAQGIFINFKNIIDSMRVRVPFGIAQIGKSFRNEITPKNFIFRTREFEQMEIEYFVEADEQKAKEAFDDRKQASLNRWQNILKLKADNLKFREHEREELSHYSSMTFDVEYKYPRGRGELQGIANRTDFDLKAHQEASGTSMQYDDPFTGKRYIPYVIEPSFGLTRTVLAVMLDCYDEENYEDGNGNQNTRVVLRFPQSIAPVKVAILPLIKKDDEQVKIAGNIYDQLSQYMYVEYDDGGAIGKRYRRQDEIGTPYCITVDHQSVEDGTVTLRHRDSMEQVRVHKDELLSYLRPCPNQKL